MLDHSRSDDAVVANFKKAMRRLTSTICIIATDEGSERFGMVATAVSSVSSDPPAILVCINRAASIWEPLLRRRRFSVNLLRADQSHLIPVFSGKVPSRERFAHGAWDERHALPFLTGAQANLFCDVDGQLAYGSHEVVIGRVRAATAADAIAPLLWQDGMPAGACALPALRAPADSLHEAGLATPA
ncbi:flavin reductase [Burkholderia sp. MSh2]|uniref:Flavin reductase domain-containing protein n=1 Tax=Burkholderia paludis TaxID=1506587 RepID=A0A6J5DEI5_9BURK|nr:MULTISPECIES: flavin reductase family protein [Burkholderia]KEZ03435.1 flavin reductase [Burkholderia sp. MSh2]CAB3751385.1 FMN reductase (NADH) RutF [Burkholderia paludis]VWB06981.1 flavin reductase domain-containing protein [Burkholderia paludis]